MPIRFRNHNHPRPTGVDLAEVKDPRGSLFNLLWGRIKPGKRNLLESWKDAGCVE